MIRGGSWPRNALGLEVWQLLQQQNQVSGPFGKVSSDTFRFHPLLVSASAPDMAGHEFPQYYFSPAHNNLQISSMFRRLTGCYSQSEMSRCETSIQASLPEADRIRVAHGEISAEIIRKNLCKPRSTNRLQDGIAKHKEFVLRHPRPTSIHDLGSSENSMVPACFQSVEVLGWSAAGTEATR